MTIIVFVLIGVFCAGTWLNYKWSNFVGASKLTVDWKHFLFTKFLFITVIVIFLQLYNPIWKIEDKVVIVQNVVIIIHLFFDKIFNIQNPILKHIMLEEKEEKQENQINQDKNQHNLKDILKKFIIQRHSKHNIYSKHNRHNNHYYNVNKEKQKHSFNLDLWYFLKLKIKNYNLKMIRRLNMNSFMLMN